MNIIEFLEKNNKIIEDYIFNETILYFNSVKLTSIKGLPEKFNKNYGINLNRNRLKNLKGLPKDFINTIWLRDNEIENLDGLNDVLDPKNIEGLNWDFYNKRVYKIRKSAFTYLKDF